MLIRAAVPADVPQLTELVSRYWQFEGIAGFAPAATAALLNRLLLEPALGRAWVAETAGQLSGYLVAVFVLSLEHQGVMAEIDEFFVLPDRRAHGAGAQLLAAAEGALAASGCVRLQLQLGVANSAARAFYERRGYQARAGYELLDKALP
jgi:GNAT superfamily N-acetyltransferase